MTSTPRKEEEDDDDNDESDIENHVTDDELLAMTVDPPG